MKQKKVIFYSTQGIGPLHLGQELEIIKRHQNKGWNIKVVTCNNVLTSCYFNPCHNLVACAMCESRSNSWHQHLGLSSDQLITLKQLNIYTEEFQVKDLNHLLEFSYKGMDLGRGVASSFISLNRNYKIDGSIDHHKKLINELLSMSMNVAENFLGLFHDDKPDKIVLFNGRFAELYPAICVAVKLGIEFETFETGSTVNRLQIFKNSLPHSIAFKYKLMQELWINTPKEEREKVGRDWYINRRHGKVLKGKSFIGKQVKNSLPEGFNPEIINVAIFNSSEDELKVIEEYQTHLYDNQNQAIQQIIEHLEGDPNIHFYLRVHPNLAGVDNSQMQEIAQWNYKNLTVIDPLDPIDTYFLMESCNKVLVFVSTTGVEATFWGKPSILYGNSAYKPTKATYCPESFQELIGFIKDPCLKPIPQEKALIYSYFLSRFGEEPKHLKYSDKHHTSFEGKAMTRFNAMTLPYFVKYLKSFPVWKKMNRLVLNTPIKVNEIFKLKSHIDKKKHNYH